MIVRGGKNDKCYTKGEVRGKVGRLAPRRQWWTKPPPTWDYLRCIQRQKKLPTYYLPNTHNSFFLCLEQTFTYSRKSVGIPASMCIPVGFPKHKRARRSILKRSGQQMLRWCRCRWSICKCAHASSKMNMFPLQDFRPSVVPGCSGMRSLF